MASIDFNNPMLRDCRCTLRETSFDKHGPSPAEYMSESDLPVFNLDAFKDQYFKKLSCSEIAKSVDALYVEPSGMGTLIEFKNGRIDKRKAYEIKKKLYDSILMLGDCCDFHISDSRDNLDFILVFNAKKNYETPGGSTGLESGEPKREEHYDAFSDAMARLAGIEIDKFGLASLENYCIRHVRTYTQKEFDEFFVKQRTA